MWDEEVDDPMFLSVGDRTAREYLVHLLASERQKFERCLLNSLYSNDSLRRPLVGSKQVIPGREFVWEIYGDFLALEPHELLSPIVTRTTNQASPPTSTSSTREPMKNLQGFGTFFYPQIWVDDIPRPSVEEIIECKKGNELFECASGIRWRIQREDFRHQPRWVHRIAGRVSTSGYRITE